MVPLGATVAPRRPALEGLVAWIFGVSLVGLARSHVASAAAPAPSDQAAVTCPQRSLIAGRHCLCDAGLTCVGGRRCSVGHRHVHPVLGEQMLHGFVSATCPSCSCRLEVEAAGAHPDSAPGTTAAAVVAGSPQATTHGVGVLLSSAAAPTTAQGKTSAPHFARPCLVQGTGHGGPAVCPLPSRPNT